MKVLITGKFTHLGSRPIGGLQSWIKTVSDELERRGHYVECWEPEHDPLNDGKTFDFGIFSNIELTKSHIPICKETVLVSHGIIEAERPDNSCDRLVFCQ